MDASLIKLVADGKTRQLLGAHVLAPEGADSVQTAVLAVRQELTVDEVVVPVTVLIIFLLLYLNFRRVTETLIVMLSVPFALVGGLWLMWWLSFNLSVAVAVGFIALAGVAAETGVVMLIYLDTAFRELLTERATEGRMLQHDDLYAAIMKGAVERVRPKMMTVAAIM